MLELVCALQSVAAYGADKPLRRTNNTAPYSNAQINELGIPSSIINGSNYGTGPFATGVTAFQPFRAVTTPAGCIRTLYNPKELWPYVITDDTPTSSSNHYVARMWIPEDGGYFTLGITNSDGCEFCQNNCPCPGGRAIAEMQYFSGALGKMLQIPASAFNRGNSTSAILFDYLATPEEGSDIEYQWVPLSEANSTEYQPFFVSGTVPACVTFSEGDKQAFYADSQGALLQQQPQRRYYQKVDGANMGSCDLDKQECYMGYATSLYTHIQQDEAEPLVLVVKSMSGTFNNTGSADRALQPSLVQQTSISRYSFLNNGSSAVQLQANHSLPAGLWQNVTETSNRQLSNATRILYPFPSNPAPSCASNSSFRQLPKMYNDSNGVWYVAAAQPERNSNPYVMGIAQRPTLGRSTLVTRPYGRNAGGSEPVIWMAAEDAEFNASALYAPATFQVLTNASGLSYMWASLRSLMSGNMEANVLQLQGQVPCCINLDRPDLPDALKPYQRVLGSCSLESQTSLFPWNGTVYRISTDLSTQLLTVSLDGELLLTPHLLLLCVCNHHVKS
ncbi:hypothetical protein WJX74_010244 [Apatococcus lobatus]|uniref:Uncharacterized protein n=1 Tax=Apatococcus lobatus TaxID=904363 RepID=A0AAW1RP81_9CHLO